MCLAALRGSAGLWGGLGEYHGWGRLEQRGGREGKKKEMAEKDGDKEGETEREEGALNGFCSSPPSRLFISS